MLSIPRSPSPTPPENPYGGIPSAGADGAGPSHAQETPASSIPTPSSVAPQQSTPQDLKNKKATPLTGKAAAPGWGSYLMSFFGGKTSLAKSTPLKIAETLHQALQTGEITSLTGDRQALRKADKEGKTVLHHALALGYGDVVRETLKMPDDSLWNLEDNEGNTPLHLLISSTGYDDVIRTLLYRTSIEKVERAFWLWHGQYRPYPSENNKLTPLELAAANKHPLFIEIFNHCFKHMFWNVHKDTARMVTSGNEWAIEQLAKHSQCSFTWVVPLENIVGPLEIALRNKNTRMLALMLESRRCDSIYRDSDYIYRDSNRQAFLDLLPELKLSDETLTLLFSSNFLGMGKEKDRCVSLFLKTLLDQKHKEFRHFYFMATPDQQNALNALMSPKDVALLEDEDW